MEQWPIKAGVYRIYAEQTGESYVGFTRNLNGTYKRLRFELKLNACSYKALQQFYNVHEDMAFELLEVYDAPLSMSDEEVDAHLQALVFKHKAALNAQMIQMQI